MFSLFDDAALLAKRAAAFITGRGATMTAVAIASRFVGTGAEGAAFSASFAPTVGLAVGLPITAAMSTMEHHHRETRIMNNFREEIAAQFGIAPEDVTHDHLRGLAFGNDTLGIKPQPFFQEVLRRNDKNRLIDIGGNMVAAVMTLGFLSFQGANVAGAISSGLAGAGIVAASAMPLAGALGLAAVAGVMMLAMDHVFTAVGNELFAEKGRTSYEKLEDLARKQGKGLAITEEQVFGVVASTHPDITAAMQQRYGGKPIDLLPKEQTIALMNEFAPQLHLKEIAEKINNGSMKINELGFIASGERSGVAEREPFRQQHATFQPQQGIKQAISHFRTQVQDHMQEQQLAAQVLQGNHFASEAHTQQALGEAMAHSQSQKDTQKPSFAARFADKQAENKALSHVDRLLQSYENDATIKLH